LTHPFLDTTLQDRPTTSEVEFFDHPVFPVALQRRAVAAYIPSVRDRKTELASPRRYISAAQAKLQPTTLIINSSVDILRDDGLLYSKILQSNGVDCAVFTSHGQIHLSEVFEATRQSETPKVVVRLMCEEIRRAIGGK
jgi:acetyl esterase